MIGLLALASCNVWGFRFSGLLRRFAFLRFSEEVSHLFGHSRGEGCLSDGLALVLSLTQAWPRPLLHDADQTWRRRETNAQT